MEMIDSVDDLKTSRSTGGHRFPNSEMLDAKIASALKKIITNPWFEKRVSLEEQKEDQRKTELSVTGAQEAVLDFTNLFDISSHGDDLQDFDTRWDQALLSTSEVPKDSVLERLYMMRIRESDQIQTVLAFV